MRLITIDEYNPLTMVLARPIYDRHRRILLGAGRKIHPVYLQKLEELDIYYLFVEEATVEGITMEEMMDMPSWMDSIEVVQEAFETVAEGGELPVRKLQLEVVKLMNEVNKRKALCLIPTSSLAEELREYAHAVNVTLIGLQLAKKYSITQIHHKDLALGCLLHDIGKVVQKNNDDHPKAGFEYLRKFREISLLAAHVAYQHHEAYDGSGTPRGLSGEEIHDYAQICSIGNVYDRCLAKKGMTPHLAMEYIMAKTGTLFSQELVNIFLDQIPSYIPGTKVVFNNGRKGVVTKILENAQRPFVRFFDTGKEISLVEHPTILIKEVIQGEKMKGTAIEQ